jgi:N6-L-threonylcarbamoyladenine synthase
MENIIDLPTPDDTDLLGSALAYLFRSSLEKAKTKVPFFLLLNGDLGAGKSCVARSFIKSLTGEQTVPSPSYLVCLTYKKQFVFVEQNAKKSIVDVVIHHIDPYRLSSKKSLEGLIDIESIKNDIIVIEHSDKTKIKDFLDERYIVEIDICGKMDNSDKLTNYSLTAMGRSAVINTTDQCNSFYLDNLFEILKQNKNRKIHNLCDDSDNDKNDLEKFNIDDRLTYIQTRDPSDVLIMGVETSCDDTCISVINGKGDILINHQIGQGDEHASYGGVNPGVARVCHRENLKIYAESAITDIIQKRGSPPDAIAFTIGPGLEVCLTEGVSRVYELSAKYKIPIIPTHHLESHIAVSRLPSLDLKVEYPYVCCIVSGGHTFVCYVEKEGKYRLLSTTIDDSIGETIDKIGRELGVPTVPAGRDVEALASNGDKKLYSFPKPYIKSAPHNMSYSGLKQSGLLLIRNTLKKGDCVDEEQFKKVKADIAASFQESIMNYLVFHLKSSCQRIITYGDTVKCIVVAGGVASNTVLRNKLNDLGTELGLLICYPPIKLCTDNGVMVAWNGYEKIKQGYMLRHISEYDPNIKHEVRSVWKLW